MTRSDSDRPGAHRPEGEAAFDALLARAVDMPTDEAALAARVAARIAAEGSRPAPVARIAGPALAAALACSLALAVGYGGAGWLAGRSDALLGLALGSGDAILTIAAAPAGGV